MEAAANGYRLFYRQLVRFESEFPSKLRPDSPAELGNVRYIHQVVTPDDQDFVHERAERIHQRVTLVIRLTHIVLNKILPYIRTGEHWWVRAKLNTLGVYSSLVEMGLLALGIHDGGGSGSSYDIYATSTGAGGLNFGEVEEQHLVDNNVLRELRRLMEVLN